MKTRWVVLSVLSGASVALGCFCVKWGVSSRHGMILATTLGDASAVLFGVFGIWLGICYSEEMHDQLVGKEGDDLLRSARGLVSASARCDVLLTGLGISSVIFFMSLLARIVGPVVAERVTEPRTLVVFLKGALFSSVLIGFVFQTYSILTPIAIMADAMIRLRETRREAEDILRRDQKF